MIQLCTKLHSTGSQIGSSSVKEASIKKIRNINKQLSAFQGQYKDDEGVKDLVEKAKELQEKLGEIEEYQSVCQQTSLEYDERKPIIEFKDRLSEEDARKAKLDPWIQYLGYQNEINGFR